MSFQENVVTFAAETTTFNGMKTSNVCHINGKEKDFETGYHYYGARYCDSEKINWLSVDPLSDKYPSMSPYAYCANNPVILIWIIGNDGTETQFKEIGQSYDGNDEYTKEVFNALNKIAENAKVCKNLEYLIKAENIYTMIEYSEIDCANISFYSNRVENRIQFNNRLGLFNLDNPKERMSPASCLYHEICHGITALRGVAEFSRLLHTENDNFGNDLEKVAIEMEYDAVPDNGLKRKAYAKGIGVFETKNSTSTQFIKQIDNQE